jgi:hypothetical protein
VARVRPCRIEHPVNRDGVDVVAGVVRAQQPTRNVRERLIARPRRPSS